MSWPRALAPAAVALVILSFLAGAGSCERSPSLELLRVVDVIPRDVEVGDRMVISGEGFPSGKPARVTFRGALHRPGERPQSHVVIEATGTAASPARVEIPFDDPLQTLFCRSGDGVAHTTFEGDVEVAFAPETAGTAPVSGILPAVTLDVRPSRADADAARDADGERFLTFLGARMAPAGRSVGLRVRQVDPGSRAEAAGLTPGDVLVAFDGVRVGTPGDVLPPPGEREATARVRHEGDADPAERVLTVPVDGFRRSPPVALFGACLAVLAALTLVWLSCGTGSGPMTQALDRARSRVRALGSSTSAFATMLGPAIPSAGAPAVVDLVVCALIGVLPFGQYVVAAKLDVGVLFAAATTGLAAASFLAARSFWTGLRGAMLVLWRHVPPAIAAGSVVLGTGSLRVQEVEHAQGGMPWEWLAFRSPASLLAAVLVLQALRIEPSSPETVRLPVMSVSPPATSNRWLAAVIRAHGLVVAALACALFFGGWALPGLSPAQQDSRPWLEVAGASLFLAKVAAVVSLAAVARWAFPPGASTDRGRAAAVVLVPLSGACAVTAVAWTGWGFPPAAQLLTSASLVVVTLLVAAGVAHRLFQGAASSSADAHLSPFI